MIATLPTLAPIFNIVLGPLDSRPMADSVLNSGREQRAELHEGAYLYHRGRGSAKGLSASVASPYVKRPTAGVDRRHQRSGVNDGSLTPGRRAGFGSPSSTGIASASTGATPSSKSEDSKFAGSVLRTGMSVLTPH
jgi:hypothetical protein